MSPPQYAGKGCPDLVETTNCNSKCCAVNCVNCPAISVSTRWSSCYDCGKDGSRTRYNYFTREVERGVLLPYPNLKLRNAVVWVMFVLTI